MQEIKMTSCPECGSKKIELKNFELLCNKCGTVLKENCYSGERIVA